MVAGIRPEMFKGWQILVVDDEPDNLAVITILLNMQGAEIISGKNGEEGFQLAKAHLPAFILADLSMPKVTGWEMIKLMKADAATKDIPIIALTAHALSGDRDKVMTAGFNGYMTKPINPHLLMRDLLKFLTEIPAMAARLELEAPVDKKPATAPLKPDTVVEAKKPATAPLKPDTIIETKKPDESAPKSVN